MDLVLQLLSAESTQTRRVFLLSRAESTQTRLVLQLLSMESTKMDLVYLLSRAETT